MGTVYYLAFGHTDGWYGKYLTGYTHLSMGVKVNGVYVQLHPTHHNCVVDIGSRLSLKWWDSALQITVEKVTRRNRLIKLNLQTCATFAQYVMGIDTGAYLCQTLYDRLTTRKYPGVEVVKWE